MSNVIPPKYKYLFCRNVNGSPTLFGNKVAGYYFGAVDRSNVVSFFNVYGKMENENDIFTQSYTKVVEKRILSGTWMKFQFPQYTYIPDFPDYAVRSDGELISYRLFPEGRRMSYCEENGETVVYLYNKYGKQRFTKQQIKAIRFNNFLPKEDDYIMEPSKNQNLIAIPKAPGYYIDRQNLSVVSFKRPQYPNGYRMKWTNANGTEYTSLFVDGDPRYYTKDMAKNLLNRAMTQQTANEGNEEPQNDYVFMCEGSVVGVLMSARKSEAIEKAKHHAMEQNHDVSILKSIASVEHKVVIDVKEL